MKRAVIRQMINKGCARWLPEVRADSNESLAMARQLEYIITKVYEYKYAEAIGRSLMPTRTDVPSGAKSYTYRITDQVGSAKIIDSYADDLPLVNVRGEEQSSLIQGIGDAFFVSIQDIRAAAMAGIDIDAVMGTTARKIIERTHDQIIAYGSPAYKLSGFATNANVLADSLVTGGSTAGLLGAWLTNTAAQILQDIEFLSRIIYKQSTGVWGDPDTGTAVDLVLSQTLWSVVASKRLDQYNQITIGDYVKAGRIPFLRSIRGWARLNTAGGDGNSRVVGYVNSDEVLSVVVPQEFEMLPMQIKNMGYEIPCHMRTGGVQVIYPAAMFYADHLEN